MKRIKITPDGISVGLNRAEADLLADAAAQVAELLSGYEHRDGDPALERLLPDGYRDSAEDADEFRRFTQTELVDEKVAGARIILDALQVRTEDGAARLVLSQPDAFAWLRSLNDIRLALAARLGIVDEKSRPPLDDTYAIYLWIGQLQYFLLRAVDR